jgi:putative solute:sodium symporter small subunit
MPPTPVDPGIDATLPAVERAHRLHWRRTLCLTGGLLLVWFLVGFVITWFARDLDFAFFGWPFSFWVAAQGGVIVFVALLAVYARRMARNDRRLAGEGGTDDGGTAGAPHR